MSDCLFCKMAAGEIAVEALYEDEDVLAFKDIDPKAPLHVLIIPKKHMDSAANISGENGVLVAKIFEIAAQIAEKHGGQAGYRMVTNVGKDGGQSVQHLHFHLLGGRSMAWPPG